MTPPIRWDRLSKGWSAIPPFSPVHVMSDYLVFIEIFCVRLGGELQLPL